MGNGRQQVSKKIQRECFGWAVVTMSAPSGSVFATKSPQRVALADMVRQEPSGNVLLDPWPRQPTLQPHGKVTTCLVTKPCPCCCFRASGGLHWQHCFIAERLSWRCTGAAPPKQHTATLHRWIIIYRDLVVMCSTKSFTTFKIPYLLFMRDLSIIY